MQAVRGLWDSGCLALSNGAPHEPVRSHDLGRYSDLVHVWAVGVAIVVRKDFPGHWSDVQRDSVGRGAAGTVTLGSGVVLRVMGMYAPTGSSLPGFDAVASRVSDEARLVAWVRGQLALCWDKGWYPLAGGDLNSITSPFLDCWGGSHVVRPSSPACVLASEGLVDAFRHRHAALSAFTFYTCSGSASQLDAVWSGGPLFATFPPINAAILWQWEGRVDHDPVVVDFLFCLPPSSPPKPPGQPIPWKELASRIRSSELPALQHSVLSFVQAHLSEFYSLSVALSSLQQDNSVSALFPLPFEGLDGPP